ncbi:MAG: hypothetical protein M1835_003481 [Candelina submexicana]|nr:MAG: hypothetical protein M1835_003481 [Candelina submexicana]
MSDTQKVPDPASGNDQGGQVENMNVDAPEGSDTWKARKYEEMIAAKAAEESSRLASIDLDGSRTTTKDLMSIFKRQEKWVAVTNLDPITKKEFMDSYAMETTDLSWQAFHDLMVAQYQQPDASRLARRKLYSSGIKSALKHSCIYIPKQWSASPNLIES